MEEVNKRICRWVMEKFTDADRIIDNVRYKKIGYSINVIIDYTEKMLILIVIFCMIGRIKEFLVCALIVWMTRRYMGGIHMNTWIGCTCMTCIFYIVVIMLGSYIEINLFYFISLCILYATFMISIAPISSKQRPVYDVTRKKKIRVRGVIGITVGIIVYLCVISLSSYVAWTILFGNIEVMVVIGGKGGTI